MSALSRPRLVLICGLPASGKTTLARRLAEEYHAIRLNPDEWMIDLQIDLHDEEFRSRLEAEFWILAHRLLELGTSVVLEWGFWARSERDEKRQAARALGVSVELRFLDTPFGELLRRVEARGRSGGVTITRLQMDGYRSLFEAPTADELGLFDQAMG